MCKTLTYITMYYSKDYFVPEDAKLFISPSIFKSVLSCSYFCKLSK